MIHGLRTESVAWGMEAQRSSVRTRYGSLLVQVNVSNTDWETDCGRHCPGLRRHISDFRTQRIFAFDAMAITPDSVRQMGRSGLVWKPLAECKNANCVNSRIDSYSSSW